MQSDHHVEYSIGSDKLYAAYLRTDFLGINKSLLSCSLLHRTLLLAISVKFIDTDAHKQHLHLHTHKKPFIHQKKISNSNCLQLSTHISTVDNVIIKVIK